MIRYVIKGGGNAGWWSNRQGWVEDLSLATRYHAGWLPQLRAFIGACGNEGAKIEALP